MSPPSPSTSHPLAEPFAEALFAPHAPEPIEFVMLLSKVARLAPRAFVTMWCDVVAVGRGTPVGYRERAEYTLSAPSRLSQATRLATMLGEATPSLQILVVSARRLSLQRQVKGCARPMREASATGS